MCGHQEKHRKQSSVKIMSKRPLILNISDSDIERFWSYVRKSPDEPGEWPWGINKKEIVSLDKKRAKITQAVLNEGCWEWQASRDEKGYGYCRIGGHIYRTHRLAWIINYKTQIPPDRLICHTCDNPSCVNINHLWLGTHQMNLRDVIYKRGKFRKSSNRKVKESDLPKMMDLYKNGASMEAVARKYKLSGRGLTAALRKYNFHEVEKIRLERQRMRHEKKTSLEV